MGACWQQGDERVGAGRPALAVVRRFCRRKRGRPVAGDLHDHRWSPARPDAVTVTDGAGAGAILPAPGNDHLAGVGHSNVAAHPRSRCAALCRQPAIPRRQTSANMPDCCESSSAAWVTPSWASSAPRASLARWPLASFGRFEPVWGTALQRGEWPTSVHGPGTTTPVFAGSPAAAGNVLMCRGTKPARVGSTTRLFSITSVLAVVWRRCRRLAGGRPHSFWDGLHVAAAHVVLSGMAPATTGLWHARWRRHGAASRDRCRARRHRAAPVLRVARSAGWWCVWMRSWVWPPVPTSVSGL